MESHQSNNEPILPDFFREPVEETTKLIKRKPEQGSEKVLLDGADSDFWREVKKIVEEKKGSIEEAYHKSLRSSVDLQEIGLRALISDLVGGALQEIIDTVELPVKAQDIKRKEEDDKRRNKK